MYHILNLQKFMLLGFVLLSSGENTVSVLGRIILIIWLFVVLIINSSYTASLTSILTVQQLSSPIKGIETLVSSKNRIGYQQGSFARNYLIEELKIDASRLVALNSPEECAKALKDGPHKGGVAAIVDDRAYIELFLSTRCEFSIVGQEFTKNGWGFVSGDACNALILLLIVCFTHKINRIHVAGLSTGLSSSSGHVNCHSQTFREWRSPKDP